MKILYINKIYHPEIGGIESVVKQYAEYFSSVDEVDVLVASKHFKLKTKKEIINNVNIIRCSSIGTFFSMPISFSILILYFINKNKYDIIHFHEPFPIGTILSLLPSKAKIIITWHSDIIRQKIFGKIINWFQIKACKKADVILTTSPRLKANSMIINQFNDKACVLPLSINLNNYKIVKKIDMKLPKRFILFLGRLSYYKGIEDLLQAYLLLKSDIPLVIVGTGEEAVKVLQFMKNNPQLNIVFINRHVSEEEKKYIISKSELFIFPSKYPSEAFGILQLEAMAYAKPIINTSLPTGVPWVSKHGLTGLTVPPGDVKKLAKAIDLLSTNKKLRIEYGNNALKRVNNLFSDDVVLKKVKKVYKDLMKKQ